MRSRPDIEVLRQIPLFAGTDDIHLKFLSFSAKRGELETGSVLFQKGKEGAAAYLVLTGTAEIYEDAEAAGRVVATAESGALLGELSMIANVVYGVTVKTASDFAAKRIDRDLFIRMAGEFPEFGMGIMRNIAERLGRSAGAFKELRPLFQT